jgi:hypothetical protein
MENPHVTLTGGLNPLNPQKSVYDTGVSFSIDWLQVSIDRTPESRFKIPMNILGSHPAFEYAEKGQGKRWYDTRVTMECGATLEWSSSNDMLPALFSMRGEALRKARALGLRDAVLVAMLNGYQTKNVPRIDVAIDFFNVPNATVENAWNQAKSTRTRENPHTHNRTGRGETQYWGAPTSERRTRAYDKAAEQKLSALLDWLRIETQCRNKWGKRALETVRVNGLEKGVFNIVNGHLNIDAEWFKLAENGESIDVPMPEKIDKWEVYADGFLSSAIRRIDGGLSLAKIKQIVDELSKHLLDSR